MLRLRLAGKKFNRLFVLRDVGNNKSGESLWLCQCNCGKTTVVRGTDLKSNNTKSCGCLNNEKKIERNKNNTYGRKNKGKVRTEEMRKRISEGHKGICWSEEQKRKVSASYTGENNPFYGKQHSCETKQKISIANKGEKSGKYKHGLTGTKAYDNHRVQKRNARKLKQTPVLTLAEEIKILLYYKKAQELGPEYHVDHIKPLSKGGLHHPDNLQILLAKINDEKFNKWPLSGEEKINYAGIRL